MSTRLHWIDTAKAICMICVYIAHTEAFTTNNETLGKAVLPFYVNAFFFISGYLLYKKYLRNDVITNYSFTAYKKGLLNCIYKLAIPTVIFSIILYLPKMLFHGELFNVHVFSLEILGGTSFWFTSALFIAQLVSLTLFLTKKKNHLFYLGISTIIFLIMQINCDYSTKPATEYFPWFWRTGLTYLIIMSLGGTYAVYEKKITHIILWGSLVVSIIGYYLIFTDHNVACLGLSGRCNTVGFITSIATTLILIEISKKIRANKIINFIGENSIIFYFLSGAMPATFATISSKLNITGNLSLVMSLTLSLAGSYLMTFIIVKYLPFLTDFRLIKR